MEYDTENMNSEEIYSSLRGVTEAIQSFSYRSQEDLNEPVRPESKRDDAVSPFPIRFFLLQWSLAGSPFTFRGLTVLRIFSFFYNVLYSLG